MEETRQVSIHTEDEVSLKDILLKAGEWRKYLFSKWLVIVIVGVIGAALGIIYSFLRKPLYVGELTFLVEESKSSPFAAYAGLANQFGLDLGGSSGSGVFEGDNIMEFLKSRLMVEKTLLSPVAINNKEISLADLYMDFAGLRKRWGGKPELAAVSYPLNKKRSDFSLLQDSVLNVLQELIVKGNLEVERPDKKLSFISVKCSSLNETFSKIFTERLVREAITFYIETKTKRNKVNIDRLQQQADSLESLLNKKTYSAAVTQDLNLNPARQAAGVGVELANRDKMVVQTMYSEVVKNLELSKIAMAQEAPVIQIIDSPILPLKKEKFGKLKGLILGGFLGGFLTIVILLTLKIYREILG